MDKQDIQNSQAGSRSSRKASKYIEIPQRKFIFGKQGANLESKFEQNFITTSKYTVFNFFPKCLLLQFKRYANVYFLIIAILQSIPDISPLHPFAAWAPLIFVIAISMVREGLEDLQRHRSDVELNSSNCKVFNGKEFEIVLWSKVQVGDFVRVGINETFPADIIVIKTSSDEGVCFIETSSLDGEKNLKPKGAMQETLKWANDSVPIIQGKVTCIPPDQDLYKFEGTLCVNENQQNQQKILVDSKQFLLRGSKLKNTNWVIGIVCYTGSDTKIMKNADKSKFKQSNIEYLTNKLILIILLFQILVSLTSALGAGIWTSLYFKDHKYLDDGDMEERERGGLVGVLTFFTYLVLNNTMIPISLIVSLEIVKQIQGFLIQWDEEMYCVSKQRGPKVFTTSISEELGQIEYIFSDKTGTLTCNLMEFKLLMVGGDLFGNFDILGSDNIIRKKEEEKRKAIRPSHKTFQKRPTKVVDTMSEIQVNTIDNTLVDLLNIKGSTKELSEIQSNFLSKLFHPFQIKNLNNTKIMYTIENRQQMAQEILMLLATCHECVVEQNDQDDKCIQTDSKIIRSDLRYQGPSPDEVTLVDIARHFGFVFQKQTSNQISLQLWNTIYQNNKDGYEQKVDLLMLFPFDSDRKRMSVIIRHNGIIKLYIKGADNMILDRLNKTEQCQHKAEVLEYINEFSKKGLRTLLLAMRVIEENELVEYQKEYQALADVKDREKAIAKLGEKIETNLFLLGATAVEDKLQENVPETIRDMLLAKIKVWMLTGDKMETAENIARSCKLIQPDFRVMTFTPLLNQKKETSTAAINEELDSKFKECQDIMQSKDKISKALLIEGQYLGRVLEKDDSSEKLIKIIQNCEAVVCCRATPKQKAEVVRLVKRKLNKITLAIGDGANDVNMIQEAHIGVGLYGQEGMRAVQSSDYALPEFQQLWRLVLVHGRWSYLRISEMILYFFYKNFIFTIPQFYFSFYCAFSGQTIFDDWYITLYNIIFTACPLIVRAITEQDVYFKIERPKKNDEMTESDMQYALNLNGPNVSNKERQQLSIMFKNQKKLKDVYPKLYYVGQTNQIFNLKNFFIWMFQGMVHAILVFFIHIFTIHYDQSTDKYGYSPDIWFLSISMYTSIIFIVNLKLLLHTQYWTSLMLLTMFVTSFLSYILYIFISSLIEDFSVFSTSKRIFSAPDFYLTVFLCVGAVITFDGVVMYYISNERGGMIEYLKSVIKHKKTHSQTFMKPCENKDFNYKNCNIDFSYTSQKLQNEQNGVSNNNKQ